MQVRFKKLHPDARIPYHGSASAAGYDLTAVSIEEDSLHDVYIARLGIAVEIPKGYVGLMFARSSIYQMRLAVACGVGVVDSDFRGELKCIYTKREYSEDCHYKAGDRCCQLVIIPVPEIEFVEAGELSCTERGTGGYGSTGGFTASK